MTGVYLVQVVPRRRDIERFQTEIEDLFSDLWQVQRLTGARRAFRPAVDAYYSDDPARITVVVELAGVEADEDRPVALVPARDSEVEQPGFDALYEIGTAATIHKLVRVPDGTLRILVQGLQRIRIERSVSDDPYLVAEVADVPDVVEESRE